MNRIKQLSVQEAQKIAAGEVVERPANIVKELVENSIDARATQISIYIEDGGKQLIRVVDNGCGMSVEDAHLCFKHHATSKITSVDDLTHINTFGFRGEALSSISSVSRVALLTKETESELGVSLSLEQAIVTQESPVVCEQGTDITIADLFYNVPARKKFLKTKETEWRQIVTLFEAFCLDYHAIHFKLFSEGKIVFNCPAVSTVQQRVVQLWEHTFADQTIALDPVAQQGVTISGVISSHQYNRYDRNTIFFFVNSRWVKNYKLTQALLKGYLNVLPQGRFPAAFIFITLDGAQVDINIHPRKEEVQFLHPRIVEQIITQAVKKTLEQHLSAYLKTDVQLTQALPMQPTVYEAPRPFEKMPPPMPYSFQPYKDAPPFIPQSSTSIFTPASLHQTLSVEQAVEQQVIKEETATEAYHLIGQLNDTYILLEKADGLAMIDQHAAHERVLYELFAHRFADVATIALLFPAIINVSPEDLRSLEPHLPILHNSGIDAEIFGDCQLIIKATPAHLKNVNMQELIKQVIAWVHEFQHVDKALFSKTINEKLHAQMACKAAVKAGDTLSNEQMHQLIKDLEKSDNRFTCPHGRPTIWFISTYEIEKKFKRKL